MENIKEAVEVIFQLLPGFISTWIFYTLTSYIKPEIFERVIQALVYTVITKAILIVGKPLILLVGTYHSFGLWDSETELFYQIVISIVFGVFASWCANNDFPLYLFRKDGIEIATFKPLKRLVSILSKVNLTNKTMHPTEWYSFFANSNFPAILHLEGDRRMLGRLAQYPDSPDKGHFIVKEAAWIGENNELFHLGNVQRMLISSKEVIRVEILRESIFDEKIDV